MTSTIDLPEQIKAQLQADAQEQGKPIAEVATEQLAELYAEQDSPLEPEAVEIVNAALADFERGERGILLEEVREELCAESRVRRADESAQC